MDPEAYGAQRGKVQREVDIVILQYQAELDEDEKRQSSKKNQQHGHPYMTVVTAVEFFGYRVVHESEYRKWYAIGF